MGRALPATGCGLQKNEPNATEGRPESLPTGVRRRFPVAQTSPSAEGATFRRPLIPWASLSAHGGALGSGRQRWGNSVATTCNFPTPQLGQL